MVFPLVPPATVQVRNGQCMFFMGDRWVLIGPVEYGPPVTNERGVRLGMPVKLPDRDAFFNSRKYDNDGTEEWRRWGPMVN